MSSDVKVMSSDVTKGRATAPIMVMVMRDTRRSERTAGAAAPRRPARCASRGARRRPRRPRGAALGLALPAG